MLWAPAQACQRQESTWKTLLSQERGFIKVLQQRTGPHGSGNPVVTLSDGGGGVDGVMALGAAWQSGLCSVCLPARLCPCCSRALQVSISKGVDLGDYNVPLLLVSGIYISQYSVRFPSVKQESSLLRKKSVMTDFSLVTLRCSHIFISNVYPFYLEGRGFVTSLDHP